MTNAYWTRSENAGDQLTPWLMAEMKNHHAKWVPANHGSQVPRLPYYVFAGSILNHAGPGAIVWGAGIASAQDPIDPRIDIRAVRGPLTRQRALQCGATCPEVYGDPGLLVPRFVKPAAKNKQYLFGVVPHIVDYLDVTKRCANTRLFKAIRMLDTIENVVEQITSCQYIISSSLHGIVFAHAYGIPTIWAKFSDKVGGDGTKFRDHYLSLGMGEPTVVDDRNGDAVYEDHTFDAPAPGKVREVCDNLVKACPL